MSDHIPIIPSMPEKPRKSEAAPKPGSGFGPKDNPYAHDDKPYLERKYDPANHKPSFLDDSAGLSHHYGTPNTGGMLNELPGKSLGEVPKTRSHFSRKLFLEKLGGHLRGTGWRKQLSKSLGIVEGSGFDKRVTEQIDIIAKKLKSIPGGDLISRHELKRVLGELQHERYFEEKHHREERTSDGKITLEERLGREREEKAHEVFKRLANGLLGMAEDEE